MPNCQNCGLEVFRADPLCPLCMRDAEYKARMQALHSNDGPFLVTLSSVGNPDFGQDETRPVPGVPFRVVKVATIRAASEACLAYIGHHELGGGNWSGGKVTRGRRHVANISYNGRAWKPGEWPTPEIPLDTPTRKATAVTRKEPTLGDRIARILFDDTVAARMLRLVAYLRTLGVNRHMTQALFMNVYHAVCDRPGIKDGTRSRSSFATNFARYEWAYMGALIRRGDPIAALAADGTVRDLATVRWTGGEPADLVSTFSDRPLQRAMERMESLAFSPTRVGDAYLHDVTMFWLCVLRTEIARRSCQNRDSAASHAA